mmetsp:Transcript_3519/g.22128  ORF Transcript_3519/g.22128 Transcript_3519/m.22128 type:complete len:288 (-) Transcript_3519:1879-2742(-)
MWLQVLPDPVQVGEPIEELSIFFAPFRQTLEQVVVRVDHSRRDKLSFQVQHTVGLQGFFRQVRHPSHPLDDVSQDEHPCISYFADFIVSGVQIFDVRQQQAALRHVHRLSLPPRTSPAWCPRTGIGWDTVRWLFLCGWRRSARRCMRIPLGNAGGRGRRVAEDLLHWPAGRETQPTCGMRPSRHAKACQGTWMATLCHRPSSSSCKSCTVEAGTQCTVRNPRCLHRRNLTVVRSGSRHALSIPCVFRSERRTSALVAGAIHTHKRGLERIPVGHHCVILLVSQVLGG